MNSFYLIDKPRGISSFDIIRKLRKELSLRKMGHTGTLDPLATGLVLIAVGNYTKLIPYLEKDTKEYTFKIGLDGISDSFDLGTEVNFLSKEKQNLFSSSIKKENIQKILKDKFTGKIKQLPPKYSALKVGGERAYNKIRAGEDFELKKRNINIESIKIEKFLYPNLILTAKVSAGTYIRSIAYDLGEILGCGGYIKELRRIKIGNIDLKNSQDLDKFKIENIFKETDIFSKDRFISLDKKYINKLDDGLEIHNDFSFEKGKELFVWNNNKITNIISFDGKKIKPIKKIINN